MIENFSLMEEKFEHDNIPSNKYICDFEVEFNKKKVINYSK